MPDFPRDFIIGAAKCGTTALAEAIGRHPSVYLPAEKEVSFFSNDEYYARGISWYASRFRNARPEQTLLDASTQYIFKTKSASRLRETLGEGGVRSLIAVLRHPAERAYSSYWQALSFGFLSPETTFEEALECEEKLRVALDYSASGRTLGAFRGASHYADQLAVWFEMFPRERFEILLKDELDSDPAEVQRRVCARLEIDPSSLPDKLARSNVAALPRSRVLNTLVRGQGGVGRRIRKSFPQDFKLMIKKRIDIWNRKPLDYPPMAPETRARLLAEFAPQVDRLEEMLCRDLSAWRV